MNKRHGLGRGLEALIPKDISQDDEMSNNIIKVSIGDILANEDQPRKSFDEKGILQLAESIKEHGIIQPIILNKVKNKYIIVAGERRWRAARVLNMEEVPAIVTELSDNDVLQISLIENIQRQDLNPIEEANAYRKLIDGFGLKQEELSKKVGKSRTAIANSMRLINLDERVQKFIIDGLITEGHGRALLGLQDKDLQYSFSKHIIEKGFNVRQTEKYIKDINLGYKNEKMKNKKKKDSYCRDVEERLEYFFGTKVILNDKKNKGKIEIEYYSQDDLQRILDILNV